MVENSKEKLDFTEFQLVGHTKKYYNCRRILAVFEKVASFLEFLLMFFLKQLHVFSRKTYTRKGIVISRKRVLLDYYSSFDTLDAECVLNTQNVYEPLEFCWKIVNGHEHTIKLE